MKKILQFTLTLLSLTILFTSCKKEQTDEIKNITLNVTVNAGDAYKLDLNQYGDADDFATITKQATTYITSEITKVGVIGEYNFMKAGTPKAGGNGYETVVVKIAEGARGVNGIAAGGCMPNGNNREHHDKKGHVEETNITINISVL
jgi:hypothetical protein